jgi:hypothetical protein
VELDLRPQVARAQLVGRPAEARNGALRIRPGDPAGSFLLDKLSGALGAREGKRMPIDAETGAPIEPNPVTPEFVERVLRPWIQAGAADN